MVNTKKLKLLIFSAGKSQKEVAKEVGMSANSLSNKINGLREFTVGEVVRLCDVLCIEDNAEKAEIFLL